MRQHPGCATLRAWISVGVDGSPESLMAYAVARGVAERYAAEFWPVVAHGGKGVDRRLVAEIVDRRHEDLPDEPVPAPAAAGADGELLVVGSRGLHGLKSLGRCPSVLPSGSPLGS